MRLFFSPVFRWRSAIPTPGIATLLAIYGILLIGLDVSVGYLGQINLAHAAFLGLGAYAGGLCVMTLGFAMLPALLASLLAGFVFGGLLAFPALRLEGPQFALATLSFLGVDRNNFERTGKHHSGRARFVG